MSWVQIPYEPNHWTKEKKFVILNSMRYRTVKKEDGFHLYRKILFWFPAIKEWVWDYDGLVCYARKKETVFDTVKQAEKRLHEELDKKKKKTETIIKEFSI